MLSVTCVALTPDDNFIYSGSKDCCIIKCEVVPSNYSMNQQVVVENIEKYDHVLAIIPN